MWDFQIRTEKLVITNQPNKVVGDKRQKTAVVIDVAILNDRNIRKKGHEELKKKQRLKEELKSQTVRAGRVLYIPS